jgi:hypothetical protein
MSFSRPGCWRLAATVSCSNGSSPATCKATSAPPPQRAECTARRSLAHSTPPRPNQRPRTAHVDKTFGSSTHPTVERQVKNNWRRKGELLKNNCVLKLLNGTGNVPRGLELPLMAWFCHSAVYLLSVSIWYQVDHKSRLHCKSKHAVDSETDKPGLGFHAQTLSFRMIKCVRKVKKNILF